MDQLIALAHAFHSRSVTVEEFRSAFVDAVSAMSVDEIMTVALFLVDVEADDAEMHDMQLTNAPGG
jgi:hypothetical protein